MGKERETGKIRRHQEKWGHRQSRRQRPRQQTVVRRGRVPHRWCPEEEPPRGDGGQGTTRGGGASSERWREERRMGQRRERERRERGSGGCTTEAAAAQPAIPRTLSRPPVAGPHRPAARQPQEDGARSGKAGRERKRGEKDSEAAVRWGEETDRQSSCDPPSCYTVRQQPAVVGPPGGRGRQLPLPA